MPHQRFLNASECPVNLAQDSEVVMFAFVNHYPYQRQSITIENFVSIFPSLNQITFIIDIIKICNLSNIYPRHHCSAAWMLISIHKKKSLVQSTCKVHIQSPYTKSIYTKSIQRTLHIAQGKKYVFKFLGTSSQNIYFWGCCICFLPSVYPINSIFHVLYEEFFLLTIRMPTVESRGLQFYEELSPINMHDIPTEWSCGVSWQIKCISPPAEDISTSH